MSAELRREVLRARRRQNRRRVIAGIASGAIAVTAVALLWPDERVRVVHTSSTHVITIPTPIEVEHVVTVPLDRTVCPPPRRDAARVQPDRKSTRLNSSHLVSSYAVFCL